MSARVVHRVRASDRTAVAAPAALHRVPFTAGTLMLLMVSAWWALVLISPQFGQAVPASFPPTMLHGFAFATAFMPLFMTGFLFTAGPRWLDVAPPSARALTWPVALHVTGVILMMVGAATGTDVTAFGALLLAIAWTAVGVGFAGLIRSSRVRDKLHARWVLTFWTLGIACALLYAAGLATRQLPLVTAALWLTVFAFVAPIFATVAHRVLPFFTSNAVTDLLPWRPNWALALLLLAILAFGALQTAARLDWLTLETGAWLNLAVMGPAGIALAALAWRWGLVQSLRGRSLRLLAMLHLGFVWCVLALLLAVADAAVVLMGVDGMPRLALAPLHALTMGFLGGLLFAMATRVICAHGGIALVADNFVWTLFWLLQAATLLRIADSVWPSASFLSAIAVGLWLTVWSAWATRYLSVLVRPRTTRKT